MYKALSFFILFGFLNLQAEARVSAKGDTIQVSAYPNPFYSSCFVHLQLNKKDSVTVLAFNRWGQVVATFIEDSLLDSGHYQFSWDGDSLPQDVYALYAFGRLASHSTNVTKLSAGNDTLSLMAYPNPFLQSCSISLEVFKRDTIGLKVLDMLGNTVAALMNDSILDPGPHLFTLDASQLPPGLYMISASTHRYSVARKVIKQGPSLGIKEERVNQKQNFSAYPMPFRENFTLKGSFDLGDEISLFSSLGQLLQHRKLSAASEEILFTLQNGNGISYVLIWDKKGLLKGRLPLISLMHK